MPDTVARAVADALGHRVAPVEEIQNFVEARLGEAGLDDVARAYIIYRQRHAEVRTAKAMLGVRDELKLSLAAVTVLRERYLLRDEREMDLGIARVVDRDLESPLAQSSGFHSVGELLAGRWTLHF